MGWIQEGPDASVLAGSTGGRVAEGARPREEAERGGWGGSRRGVVGQEASPGFNCSATAQLSDIGSLLPRWSPRKPVTTWADLAFTMASPNQTSHPPPSGQYPPPSALRL